MRTWRTIVAILILVFAAWRAGRAQSALSDFRITIQTTGTGAKLGCVRGCAWQTLTFDCNGKSACAAQVDQSGVDGIHGVEGIQK